MNPNGPPSLAPTVLLHKTAVMQRLADHVRLGYRLWTSGTVPAHRAQALVAKFARHYGTGRTRHQKAYGRSRGEASAALILWSDQSAPSAPLGRQPSVALRHTAGELAPTSAGSGQTAARANATSAAQSPTAANDLPAGELRWFLLVTAGDHLATRLERMRDATAPAARIELTGYELVQLARAGQERPAWTWRMTQETYAAWRERLVLAARRSHQLLAGELASLLRTPGFSGCRAQVKKLLALARGEAQRRLGAEAARELCGGRRVRYVQRLPQRGMPLAQWVRLATPSRPPVLPIQG